MKRSTPLKRSGLLQARTPMKRGKPMKKRNAKRKGSAFPKERDTGLTTWVVTQPCALAGRWLTRRLSDNDLDAALAPSYMLRAFGGFWHRCWGAKTPAHIGPHRAQGGPDKNRVVCMCQAAHQEYDEHRSRFHRVTHLTELRLKALAQRLTAEYDQERT